MYELAEGSREAAANYGAPEASRRIRGPLLLDVESFSTVLERSTGRAVAASALRAALGREFRSTRRPQAIRREANWQVPEDGLLVELRFLDETADGHDAVVRFYFNEYRSPTVSGICGPVYRLSVSRAEGNWKVVHREMLEPC